MVQQHEREECGRLGVVRQQAVQQQSQPDGLAAQLGSDHLIAAGGCVSLVEHETDDPVNRRQSRSDGIGSGHPSRLAMVGSGTRNAFAISRVLSPARYRRVSATRTSRAGAGWHSCSASSSAPALFSACV